MLVGLCAVGVVRFSSGVLLGLFFVVVSFWSGGVSVACAVLLGSGIFRG